MTRTQGRHNSNDHEGAGRVLNVKRKQEIKCKCSNCNIQLPNNTRRGTTPMGLAWIIINQIFTTSMPPLLNFIHRMIPASAYPHRAFIDSLMCLVSH